MGRFGNLIVIILVTLITNLAIWQGSRVEAGSEECVTGDVTGDGALTILDPLRLLNYLFNDGEAPVACASGGADLTDDEVRLLQGLAELVTVVEVDDPNSDRISYTTVLFEGCNVQIVNGLGATNGNTDDPFETDEESSQVNGLGNLIVGYNLPGDTTYGYINNDRTGSHNVVVGTANDYSSFGGIVCGTFNGIEAPWSSVTGGAWNDATAPYASVSGGYVNLASGPGAWVGGGYLNEASGDNGAVSGGRENHARNDYSSVTGGHENEASGEYSSVTGGHRNEASGESSAVCGGEANVASGEVSIVCGGFENSATYHSTSILGGNDNVASEYRATVSGGSSNEASGWASSVSGGQNNTASGEYSSVSGGSLDEATGFYDWVAGDSFEDD